jgi:hypothetical protein
MLTIVPPSFRKRRSSTKRKPPAVPSAPVLVAATFSGTLGLTFDRAVSISGFVPFLVVVFDGNDGLEYGGTAEATQPGGPNTVEIGMIENGEYPGTGVLLTVTSGAGIVAAEGGAAWAGVTGLGLPFSQ